MVAIIVTAIRLKMLFIMTRSSAVHGLVGDPLQIYADRLSGHYGPTGLCTPQRYLSPDESRG